MTMDLYTRPATPGDFRAIASMIHESGKTPETQCIHSGTDESVNNLVEEIENWYEKGEIVFVVVHADQELIGCMGCEFEVDGERGWLRGPIVLDHWEIAPVKMYTVLRGLLPPNIRRLDAFLNEKNTRGQAFYENNGFQLKGSSHVYLAEHPGTASTVYRVNGSRCRPLDTNSKAGFIALHDAVFPNTYYNGQQVVDQMDEQHRVWVYEQDGEILGYVYAVIENWAEEGYVEFLGVREDVRRRGIGAQLLKSALAWIFAERDMPQAGLTVSDENVNARSLYERVGFRLLYTGVNQRLVW